MTQLFHISVPDQVYVPLPPACSLTIPSCIILWSTLWSSTLQVLIYKTTETGEDLANKAAAAGYALETAPDGSASITVGGMSFRFCEGRATRHCPVLGVALNVSSLAAGKAYWQDLLSMAPSKITSVKMGIPEVHSCPDVALTPPSPLSSSDLAQREPQLIARRRGRGQLVHQVRCEEVASPWQMDAAELKVSLT